MSQANPNAAEVKPDQTSLATKMLELFVSPGMVFDEVAATPFKLRNWLWPTFLVCLVSLMLFRVTTSQQLPDKPAEPLGNALTQPAIQNGVAITQSATMSIVTMIVTAVSGSLMAALVLWLLGRGVLRTNVSFLKCLEVVGLAGTILILATITTALLVLATDNPLARPALSLLWPSLAPGSAWHAILQTLNLFDLWTVALLAIGLAKISGVKTAEAAFCVCGFWILGRIALAVLS